MRSNYRNVEFIIYNYLRGDSILLQDSRFDRNCFIVTLSHWTKKNVIYSWSANWRCHRSRLKVYVCSKCSTLLNFYILIKFIHFLN